MRVQGLILLACALTINGVAQDSKLFVREKHEGDMVEEYFVQAGSAHTKEGSYIRYHYTPKTGYGILESGKYQNGERSGVWEFYHSFFLPNAPNRLNGRGAYVNGKKDGVWRYYHLDSANTYINVKRHGKTTQIDSIAVSVSHWVPKIRLVGGYQEDKRAGIWYTLNLKGEVIQSYNFQTHQLLKEATIADSLTYNSNRPPLYLGAISHLNYELAREIEGSTFVHDMKTDSVMALVSFRINAEGNAQDAMLVGGNGPTGFVKEVLRLIRWTSGNWIPAMKDGVVVDQSVQLKFAVVRDKRTRTLRGFRVSVPAQPVARAASE